MKAKIFKFSILIMSFLVTMAILFGGTWLYNEAYVNNPLDKNLESLSYIKSYKLNIEDNILEITLNGEVNNLKVTYYEIKNRAKNVINENNKTKIHIIDKQDEFLKSVWERVQFPIYEALEKFNYSEMVEEVEKNMLELGVKEYRLQMDESNIYLEIYHKDNYLYKILSRYK